MNNKKRTILLTTAMVFSMTMPAMATSVTDIKANTPRFTYSNSTPEFSSFDFSTSNKIEELDGRKKMLEDTIYSPEYNNLTIGERLILIEKYFNVRADIFKENQKSVLSTTEILQIENLKNTLINESEKEGKDNLLIFLLIQDLKSKDINKLSLKEKDLTINAIQKVIESYKTLKMTGRDLSSLINAQMKAFNSNQLTLLNKFGQKFDINGDKKNALEVNKKILKLSGGDLEAYKNVSNLLASENKSFIFVNNEVVELSIVPLIKDEGTYMSISDLSKVDGFEIIDEENKVLIKKGQNTLEINKEDNTSIFNESPIGKSLMVNQDNNYYLPIVSLFRLFHFNVQWSSELNSIAIQQEIFPKTEIDSLPTERIVSMIIQ